MNDLFKDEQVAQNWRQGDGIANWTALFGEVLLARFRPPESGRVLDLACGAGYPTVEIADRVGPEVEVIGVDTAEAALKVGRETAGDRPNVRFEVADAGALPFPDGSFAVVTVNLGLHLFPDPHTALRECRRVLVPGGRTIQTVPLDGTLSAFWQQFEAVTEERGLSDQVPRANRLSPDDFRAWFAAAGFVDTDLSESWLDFELPDARAFVGRFPPLLMARRRLPEAVREDAWEEIVGRIETARAGGPIATRVGIGCIVAVRPA